MQVTYRNEKLGGGALSAVASILQSCRPQNPQIKSRQQKIRQGWGDWLPFSANFTDIVPRVCVKGKDI